MATARKALSGIEAYRELHYGFDTFSKDLLDGKNYFLARQDGKVMSAPDGTYIVLGFYLEPYRERGIYSEAGQRAWFHLILERTDVPEDQPRQFVRDYLLQSAAQIQKELKGIVGREIHITNEQILVPNDIRTILR